MKMFRKKPWLSAALGPRPLLAAALVPSLLLAQHVEHAPVVGDRQLTLGAVVQSALTHAPEALAVAARADQAAAFTANGRSWLAGRPNLQGLLYDDRTFQDTGLSEQEYWLQLPLWRPGERRDMAALGADYQRQSAEWRHYLALLVSGSVRDLLANLEEADLLLALEQQATTDAETLRDLTARLVDSGAAARLDLMQAESLLLQQRKRLLDASAALVDAEVVYATTTGLQARPEPALQETLLEASEIPETHPLLEYLKTSIDVAEGTVRQAEISAKGNPQFGIGTRHQRADQFTAPLDTINLGFTIPFGGKGFVSSTTSAARRSKVDAEVELLAARRALALALHDAEHELDTVRAALPLAREQAALAEQRSRMAQTAFEVGELTMVQVVPALQDARSSQRELLQLQLREQRLISYYNQALGNVP